MTKLEFFKDKGAIQRMPQDYLNSALPNGKLHNSYTLEGKQLFSKGILLVLSTESID